MSARRPSASDFLEWTWPDIEPRYKELDAQTLDSETVDSFLRQWSDLADRVQELGRRRKVAADANTADDNAAARYESYVQTIEPRAEEAEQRLKEKLLGTGLEPQGMEVPLRRMRAESELYRQGNLSLLAQEKLHTQRYFKITGAQTVTWESKEIPVTELRTALEGPDRDRREIAWRLGTDRQRRDHAALDDLWRALLDVRGQVAANADCADYRAYRWRELKRFDYTPNDTETFHKSVETVVVPAVARRYRRRQRLLGVDRLRPWDLHADPLGRNALRPYTDISDLILRSSSIFHHVDPTLGQYFDTMRQENLLDLESRENKAPAGYCMTFSASRRPFIFTVASGTGRDVEILMHEAGHAFHVFESSTLPYFHAQAGDIPIEFAEVASMAMEFLTQPYLAAEQGGFYTADEVVRSRVEHLEDRVLVLWARLAMIDAFQHWIYAHPADAMDPLMCDATWMELSRRFLPIVDWGGLEGECGSEWRNILHIFAIPFYVIEYAFALLGAVQVWSNARRNEETAVRLYRHALSLGGTRSLPDLFDAAGATFAFDEETLREAVQLVEHTLTQLEAESSSDFRS